APEVRPSVKVSRQKPVKKQTVPERILNVIGSILICLVMIAQASVAIAAEFADTVATRESVERIVAGMDVSSIMIEGKSLPETVIGGFGLDYDILGLIGVSEEKINSAFTGVTSLAASRLGQVAGRIREGSDVEDVTLVSRDEIMEILRSNDSIISSLQLPGLTGQIYDVIDRGLVEAGFGDGLTVGKIFDSLGESGAAGLKAAVAAAHAAVRSFTYIKFAFGAACAALIAALFILNKRRLRASFFWCGISCGIVAAGLLAAHFSWIQFSRIESVAALSLALQPVGVDFTLRYGVILAASCTVCLALSVVCAVVGSRSRRKRRGI
nr:hypothetical protein [Clostridiales bacterium]